MDRYYCYLTVDKGLMRAGDTLREAPCHVDGFQGARWKPKCLINHTYSMSDILPTKYYIQPFDFSKLDDAKHDFFWEMNRQVANYNSMYCWQPKSGAITLMDAYTVHRGTESEIEQERTFIRLSFEERIFDRAGNSLNPMFDYDWNMQPRDIESLNLVPYDTTCHPSLRVFPHQLLDEMKSNNEDQLKDKKYKKPKTKPLLRIDSAQFDSTNLNWWRPSDEMLKEDGWIYKEELIKIIN